MDPNPRSLRIAALGLVLSLSIASVVALGFYTRQFDHPAIVTVDTDRAGLIMDAGNKVKARGVEVGRVKSVSHNGNGIELTLELDRELLNQIPDNSAPEVRASTVFGAKYVELAAPATPSGRPLSDGARLRATSTTTEINTIFDQLNSVLTEVDTVALNTSLTTLSTTLGGRGEQIADLSRKADAYLTELEPLLPRLRRDLSETARFSATADRVAPDLLAILENATVTGETIAGRQDDLHRLLADLVVLSERSGDFIDHNGKALTTLLDRLRVPTGTLHTFSPEFPCLFQGADHLRRILNSLWGNPERGAGLLAEISVRSKSKTYMHPDDLAQVPQPGEPNCSGLPVLEPDEIPLQQVGESR